VKRCSCYRSFVGLAAGFSWGVTMATAVPVSAEPNHSVGSGRFALEIMECPKALTEGVRRFISIEVGDLLYGETEGVPSGSDTLTIRCVRNFAWLEAAGVSENTPLEKLLHLDDFPGDAAPRAVALASLELMAARSSIVRERIDASRNSTPAPTAPPRATPPRAPAITSGVVAPQPRVKPSVPVREIRIGLGVSLRDFPAKHGVSLLGGQVQASTKLGPMWQIAANAEVASGKNKVSLGETSATLLSCGASFGVRSGGTAFGASLGLGARIGAVRLSGASVDPVSVSAASRWRPWGGPMAVAGLFSGFGRFGITLAAELGQSLLKPEGQADGVTAISLRGPWAAFSLGASIRL